MNNQLIRFWEVSSMSKQSQFFITKQHMCTVGSLGLSNKFRGMTKEQVDELLKSLKNIEGKLDILVSLQKVNTPMPKIGKEEEKILKLCDKKHSIAEMMQETGKKEGTINATLNHLKNKGLIQPIRLADKVVYERIR